MNKNKFFITLTDEQKNYFSYFSDEYLFNSETHIIYSGQIPMAAYLLLDGNITLKDAKKRTIQNCEPNTLLGFSEIYNNVAYKYSAEISSSSKVFILDRSTILEIQKNFTQGQLNQVINFHQLIELV